MNDEMVRSGRSIPHTYEGEQRVEYGAKYSTEVVVPWNKFKTVSAATHRAALTNNI